MEERSLYPQSQKVVPWRLLSRVAILVSSVFVIIIASLLIARSSGRAGSFETLSDIFLIRTGLEQYSRAHAAYPQSRSNILLGAGEAMCLDSSVNGFQFTCSHDIYVSWLPRSRDGGYYQYRSIDADYRIDFVLPQSIGALRDLNKDGTIVCFASAQNIECQ